MYSADIKRARALKSGDRVRLVAPASPFNRRHLERGLKTIERLGFEPVLDKAEFTKLGFLAGSDEERAERLTSALLEPDTSAVWCIRGGYGSGRLLPKLNLPLLHRKPKVFIGFSDATALLLTLSAPGGYVTFHGPVVTQLSRVSPGAIRWLQRLVGKPNPGGKIPLGKLKTLNQGNARGFLAGGNLAVLSSLVATPYLPRLDGSILCIEDTGEEAYRLDRMFNQLLQSSSLKNVAGVVIGAFSGCRPKGEGRFGARKVIERAVIQLGVPAVSGAAFGHIQRNLALPMGVVARLNASKGSLTLLEPAVS